MFKLKSQRIAQLKYQKSFRRFDSMKKNQNDQTHITETYRRRVGCPMLIQLSLSKIDATRHFKSHSSFYLKPSSIGSQFVHFVLSTKHLALDYARNFNPLKPKKKKKWRRSSLWSRQNADGAWLFSVFEPPKPRQLFLATHTLATVSYDIGVIKLNQTPLL